MVYTVHGIILFGGAGPNDVPNRNTWLWDGQFWSHRQDIGPSPRSSHNMAYDTTRDRVVLFGGSAESSYYGDTWELKIEEIP
jgi:hypothetical protein